MDPRLLIILHSVKDMPNGTKMTQRKLTDVGNKEFALSAISSDLIPTEYHFLKHQNIFYTKEYFVSKKN